MECVHICVRVRVLCTNTSNTTTTTRTRQLHQQLHHLLRALRVLSHLVPGGLLFVCKKEEGELLLL